MSTPSRKSLYREALRLTRRRPVRCHVFGEFSVGGLDISGEWRLSASKRRRGLRLSSVGPVAETWAVT